MPDDARDARKPVTSGVQGARYETDPAHTFVTFAVKHFATSTLYGRFDRVGGFVMLDRSARKGYAEIVIDMQSINSGTPAFDEHLRSPAFFDVTNFPRATFIGRDFSFAGEKLARVAGELTLLGNVHPVTLQCSGFNCYQSPLHKAEVCGGDFEATIQRSRWGMKWGLDIGIPDEVRLLIQIEAVRK